MKNHWNNFKRRTKTKEGAEAETKKMKKARNNSHDIDEQ